MLRSPGPHGHHSRPGGDLDRPGKPDQEQVVQAAPHTDHGDAHLDGHLDHHLDHHGDPDRHLHGSRGALDDEHHDPVEHLDQQPHDDHDQHGPRPGGWARS